MRCETQGVMGTTQQMDGSIKLGEGAGGEKVTCYKR